MQDVVPQQAAEACHYLQSQIPIELQKPAIGIICGSGLGGLANVVLPHSRRALYYKDIPHFPSSTGKLGLTTLERIPQKMTRSSARPFRTASIWIPWSWWTTGSFDGWEDSVSTCFVFLGYAIHRSPCCSYYEGHTMQTITFPIRVLKLLGVDTIIGITICLALIWDGVEVDYCPSHQCCWWFESWVRRGRRGRTQRCKPSVYFALHLLTCL